VKKFVTHRVDDEGRISILNHRYHVGRFLAEQPVTVEAGLLNVSHNGVVVATHARRYLQEVDERMDRRAKVTKPARPTNGDEELRRVHPKFGALSFAGRDPVRHPATAHGEASNEPGAVVQRRHRAPAVLPWEAETGLRWAHLLAALRSSDRAMPIKGNLIAATALNNRLTVATRNQIDFAAARAKGHQPFRNAMKPGVGVDLSASEPRSKLSSVKLTPRSGSRTGL